MQTEPLSGEIDRGIAGYDRAFELAKQKAATDPELEALVPLNKQLALRRAACQEIEVDVELPAGWEDSPSLVLARKMAERAGVHCARSRWRVLRCQ